jgi:hypothetical protein
MTVPDAQAVIALMANEAAADEVEANLRGRDGIASVQGRLPG